jgi:hypothetical protein
MGHRPWLFVRMSFRTRIALLQNPFCGLPFRYITHDTILIYGTMNCPRNVPERKRRDFTGGRCFDVVRQPADMQAGNRVQL